MAIAALLLQIPAIPQEVTARLADATVNITDSAGTTPESSSAPGISAPAISAPGTEGLTPVRNPELVAPREGFEKLRRRDWLVLTVAEHSAATFDAWSTRRAISRGAYETDPLMRPFSRNASMYAAIQVGPLLLDYLSRRMMTSRHDWMRHTWWVPQVVSTAAFFASGTHNLSIFAARPKNPY